ncbi:MAG: YafY family transcriptional regulator [Bacteroidetes bacterium]|nr:YafY family transcriptional regulator [Bacteroidota bacterium]
MSNEERRANRTERLFQLILLLQNQPSMSSLDLAEHFGVSRRTIFRDLRALTDSGVPLTYGEHGGYEILDGYQLPPLMLSAREAATLLVGISFVKLQPDSSLRADADEVRLKIRSVLPSDIKRYLDTLFTTTVLDPYWVSRVNQSADEEGRWYRISEAVARQQSALIEYLVPSRGEVTKRQIDPLGLVYYSDHWNLIAFDHLRQAIRNFRLERIQTFRALNEKFEPPAGFDLNSYVRENRGSDDLFPITLSFVRDAWERARRILPARILEETVGDDRVIVSFEFPNLEYIAGWLGRFGSQVRVESPSDLRELVASEARRVFEQY